MGTMNGTNNIERSLKKTSIRSLIVLGFALFLGTGLAGGIQLYRQNMQNHKDMAIAYVNLISYEVFISSTDISELISRREEMTIIGRRMEEAFRASGQRGASEAYHTILTGYEEELQKLYYYWTEKELFFMAVKSFSTGILNAYLVIPEEKELVYIWDSETDVEENGSVPFAAYPYTRGEKKYLMEVFQGENDPDMEKVFFVEPVDGKIIGTALSPVRDIEGRICAVAAVDISVSDIRSAFTKLLLNICVAIMLIILISITAYQFSVRRNIIDPILTLKNATDGLVRNLKDNDGKPLCVDIHTGNEIEVLARSFEQMDGKLRDYIRENTAITVERERIHTELSLATRIQADMLPGTFPPFPDRHDIDIYATMVPAKEVGGDFYDFFLIDEDHLGLVIADVSGKGIPAALFMMMTKIMLQNYALTGSSPGKVLTMVNEQICRNNKETMFVTVWLGVLETGSGLLTTASAGHEYPVLKRKEGAFELFRDRHSFVVGGLEGIHYREFQIRLHPGDRLFLYTDGLPEATNARDELFGMDRALEALNEVKDRPAREVLSYVSETINRFVGEAPRFDDTTMLCLDYYGPAAEKGRPV